MNLWIPGPPSLVSKIKLIKLTLLPFVHNVLQRELEKKCTVLSRQYRNFTTINSGKIQGEL